MTDEFKKDYEFIQKLYITRRDTTTMVGRKWTPYQMVMLKAIHRKYNLTVPCRSIYLRHMLKEMGTKAMITSSKQIAY